MKLNLDNIFNVTPRANRNVGDRFTRPKLGIHNNILANTKLNTMARSSRIEHRHIDTSPYKVLDAPGMLDNYYLNLLDWSSTNILAIGLNESVYTYNVNTKDVNEIFSCEDYVSSVKCNGNILCIGSSTGEMGFYDITTGKLIQKSRHHLNRVSALSWNGNVISSGDKEGVICNYDIRSNVATRLARHDNEICGLSWSNDLKYLASGGDDNIIKIWQMGSNNPLILSGHKSAVKALAWCPWRSGILASGGGTNDKTIKFWDVVENKIERSVDTQSQVCTLTYVPKYKELISSHGYSQNDIRIWKATTMNMICSFGHHDSRVLHVALSPENTEIASVAADENLKFWKIFQAEKVVARRESIAFR